MMQKICYSPIADQEQDLEKNRDYKIQNVTASLIKIPLELSISLRSHHIIFFFLIFITDNYLFPKYFIQFKYASYLLWLKK